MTAYQPRAERGVAGGYAALDPQGRVLDGSGVPVTGEGGGPIQAGSIGADKLAFDPATQPELDAVAAAVAGAAETGVAATAALTLLGTVGDRFHIERSFASADELHRADFYFENDRFAVAGTTFVFSGGAANAGRVFYLRFTPRFPESSIQENTESVLTFVFDGQGTATVTLSEDAQYLYVDGVSTLDADASITVVIDGVLGPDDFASGGVLSALRRKVGAENGRLPRAGLPSGFAERLDVLDGGGSTPGSTSVLATVVDSREFNADLYTGAGDALGRPVSGVTVRVYANYVPPTTVALVGKQLTIKGFLAGAEVFTLAKPFVGGGQVIATPSYTGKVDRVTVQGSDLPVAALMQVIVTGTYAPTGDPLGERLATLVTPWQPVVLDAGYAPESRVWIRREFGDLVVALALAEKDGGGLADRPIGVVPEAFRPHVGDRAAGTVDRGYIGETQTAYLLLDAAGRLRSREATTATQLGDPAAAVGNPDYEFVRMTLEKPPTFGGYVDRGTRNEIRALAGPVNTPSGSGVAMPLVAQITNTAAAAQPANSSGRWIAALTKLKGKVYVSYGDYGANTGPVRVSWLDPANPASGFTVDPLDQQTEALEAYRYLPNFVGPGVGAIVAPHVDPRGPNGGYAFLRDGQTAWEQVTGSSGVPVAPSDALHCFDVIEFNGSAYLAGSVNPQNAALWRLDYANRNRGWVRVKDFAEAGPGARFYGLWLADDSLLFNTGSSPSQPVSSYRLYTVDGNPQVEKLTGTFTPLTNGDTSASFGVFDGYEVVNRYGYASVDKFPRLLGAEKSPSGSPDGAPRVKDLGPFYGVALTDSFLMQARAVAVDGAYLYVLRGDGKLIRLSGSATSPQGVIVGAPALPGDLIGYFGRVGVHAMCVTNGKVLLGTVDSRVLIYDLPS